MFSKRILLVLANSLQEIADETDDRKTQEKLNELIERIHEHVSNKYAKKEA